MREWSSVRIEVRSLMFPGCMDHSTGFAAPRCCLKVGSFCTLPWNVLPPWCAHQTLNRAGTMWAALYICCAFLVAFLFFVWLHKGAFRAAALAEAQGRAMPVRSRSVGQCKSFGFWW